MAYNFPDRASDAPSFHQVHADEAERNRAAARNDEARTHFDHALMHHQTSKRILERVETLRNTAIQYRQTAAVQRSLPPHRRQNGLAEYLDQQAIEYDAAAEASPHHAHQHYLWAIEHAAAGREKEGKHPTDEEACDAAAALIPPPTSRDDGDPRTQEEYEAAMATAETASSPNGRRRRVTPDQE